MNSQPNTTPPGTEAHVHLLHVRVVAPGMVNPKPFEFPPTELVGAAAAQAASKLGFSGNNPTFIKLEHGKEQMLDRTQTLAQAGVHDGDELELVDVGGGV